MSLLISMSGKGNCYDNAVVETFFKTIKSELIWPVSWQTRSQAENAVARYIDGFYNPIPYYDVDPYNYKETADNDFSVEVLDMMTKRIPPLQGARVIDGYAALYDVTPDWTPFFGPRTGLEGYYDACGGSGHAFKTGPILARELVDWMLENRVEDDYRRLSYDRVGDDNLFVSTFGGNRC